ncbi:hypothetical protein EJ06DRAFT_487711 [Trichodelitschia bisporula]|uniref:TLC domain-containing protein n=1 Tax=Trichodelitschia bisporula TaxID=703511 RepID=A0A6G1I9R4_9PEZI|nr:hypothetical protein EJ06DRAFT_487711 [Trichodelitschia bisporula]
MDELRLKNRTSNGHHRRPHIAVIPNQQISNLTAYSGLIITIWMVILFFIRFYILEGFIFPRFYGRKWRDMDDPLKRGFMNHHIAGGVKIVLLIAGAKPFVNVVFGYSDFTSPMGKHAHPTMGDLLIVLTQLFVAMYVFELFYRKTLSPVAVMHHVGAVIIAQSAVVLSLDLEHERDATIEFVLCLVWGAFDVLAEGWLNLAFILYRIHPRNHAFLCYLFFSTCAITVMGSVAETIMIMVLFGQSWSRWELSFKIVTPILHFIFTLAQLHGSRILFSMWLKQKRYLKEEDEAHMDPELGRPKASDEAKPEVIVTTDSGEASRTESNPPDTPEASTMPSGSTTEPPAETRRRIGPITRFITGLR